MSVKKYKGLTTLEYSVSRKIVTNTLHGGGKRDACLSKCLEPKHEGVLVGILQLNAFGYGVANRA